MLLVEGVHGVNEEVALLRVKIKSILEHDPENNKLILQATNILARMAKTKHNIGKEDKNGLIEAIGNVMRDIALPLGIPRLRSGQVGISSEHLTEE